MSNKMEIEALTKECLTKTGAPRKECDLTKLKRLLELKASETVLLPEVENAPDDVKKLQSDYQKLVWRIYEEAPDGNINAVMDGKAMTLKIKPKVTAKMMTDLLRMKDMVRQPEPKPERVKVEKTAEGKIQITVKSGPPVTLEGKNEFDQWKIVAAIMPAGGKIQVPGDRYSAFRIVRGSDKPEYVAPPASGAAPNKKVTVKNKPVVEI